MPRQSVTPELLRAWWAHKQGLLEPLASATPAAVLARAGWARSVAGAGPYLTLHARAGLSREAVDAAVAAVEIHELPAARSCTYVLPASDYALALTLAAAAGDGEMKLALKLGVTPKEVDALCDAVLLALKNGPAEPDRIRATVGPKARSLGADGRRKGLASTLPLALDRLQVSGHIRRLPTNGRLDQQRYRYALWNPNPLKNCKLSSAEAYTALARLYFQWIGPATPAEFQWFSGLGVKTAAEALASLGLVPLETGSDRLLFPHDLDALWSFKPPADPVYRLVSSLDSLVLLRRDHRSLMDPADLDRSLELAHGPASLSSLADLPCHAILDRGRLVGLWDYDPASESIVCFNFIQRNKDLDAAIKNTEEYVRTQLGDARSFSLDSPKSRLRRLAALRQAAG
ncbi:MAG: crosslink repair DNA glycosylase YcaQ family protein [Bryobacteraceae bacterium]|jgi:hypothetical protein